ncbi:MAG: DUF6338 family protein [Spirochaetaceae bacterium]|jgi:hypothetical protein|nr:DUF6338 family protein [Spirochaetaceae bacterium]
MTINAFIFKLLIVLIPGFVCFSIFRKIAVYRRDSKKDFGFREIIIIIVYSLIICMFYDLILTLVNYLAETKYPFTLSKLVDVEMYTATELALLCLIAIISGYLLSIMETRKFINKIAMSLKITNYYGDTDVWTSFCANKSADWIYVRDHKFGLIYYGLLEQYSDPGEERELIITDVMVFSKDGEFCYNCPRMYVCRQANDITLEIPQAGEGEKNGTIE